MGQGLRPILRPVSSNRGSQSIRTATSAYHIGAFQLISFIRLRLPLRLAPAIDYPETIDVELPDSFKNDLDTQRRMFNERGGRRLGRMEFVAPLPAGWNPNLLLAP